jgi:hypothetical protein
MRGLDGPWPTEYRRERVSTRKDTAMPETRTRTVVLIGASFYLTVMSFAGGVATERIRVDRERGEVLRHYDEAVREWHEFRMTAERKLEDGAPAIPDVLPEVR